MSIRPMASVQRQQFAADVHREFLFMVGGGASAWSTVAAVAPGGSSATKYSVPPVGRATTMHGAGQSCHGADTRYVSHSPWGGAQPTPTTSGLRKRTETAYWSS